MAIAVPAATIIRILLTRIDHKPMAAVERHYERSIVVRATAAQLFAHLDNPARASEHMSRSSWLLGGGRMTMEVDEDGGQQVGSLIRIAGRILGLQLSLEEVVIERDPPYRKLWETIGRPRLLVIGSYRMGFEIVPGTADSLLRVFIDYRSLENFPARWLGYLFGSFYARWCVDQMITDAARRFRTVVRIRKDALSGAA